MICIQSIIYVLDHDHSCPIRCNRAVVAVVVDIIDDDASVVGRRRPRHNDHRLI